MGVQYGTVSSEWGTGLNWWGYDKHEAIAGVTLAEAEYPVAITLTGFGIGSYWQNMRNKGTAWGNVYLCDNDNVATSLYMLAVSVRDQATSSEGNGIRYTFSDADGKLLKHKTLGIRLTAPGAVSAYDLGLNGKLSVKVETKLEQVTIKVNSATGGTATASKSIALPGEQITLTVTPSTGYQLKSWTVVSGGITVTNNKFTAGSTNIEITPVWEKINYTITAAASPAEGGTVTAPGTGQYGDTISFSQSPNTGYQLRNWTTSGNVTLGSGSFTMPAGNVRLQANYTKIPYTITQVVEPAGGGVITAPATAGIRDEVEVSQTPSTGYTFSHWELSSGVVKDGKFTMPAAGVTLKAVYIRNAYQITARANPEGAGVITVQGTAGYADQVAVSQVPANGYYFNGWTLSSGGSVTNGSFSMPDGAVTVTANYLRRSTATLSTDRLKGGESIRAAIVSEDPAYSHQYRITFPNRGIDSGAIDIPAGTTSLDVPIPKAWAAEETGAATISGGVFTLYTYRGNTLIGSHDTGGLTYAMPDDAAPEITSCVVTRTTNPESASFADLGVYVQNHSGAAVSAAAAGKYGGTISSIRVNIQGYTGTKYDRTYNGNSARFQSGILTNAGDLIILVTATDSRGLTTTTRMGPYTVEAYVAPVITGFEVWRVDSAGDPDDTAEYGKYRGTYQWTQVGSNTVERSVTVYGTEQVVTTDEDWILPGNRQLFPATQTAMITYTVRDRLEETSVTIRMDTRRFIMHFNAAGNSAAFGHAVQETPSSGSRYTGTFEIDESMEVWIGHETLKDYILDVVNGNV